MSNQSLVEVQKALSQAPLDPVAGQIIVNNLNTSASALAACQGTEALKLNATAATITVLVVDESGSMDEVADTVRQSLREDYLLGMTESKQAAAMTLSLLTFNNRVVSRFANQPVKDIEPDKVEYRPEGGTALYDAVLDGLTGAIKYQEDLMGAGMTNPKVIFVVFSDGADNSSRRADAGMIRKVVEREILAQRRESWVLAFVGFKTYESARTDFRKIASDMGFEAIIEVDVMGTKEERQHKVREILQLVSKSSIRQSQTTIDPNAPNSFFAVP